MCNAFDICTEYDATAAVTEKTSFTEEEKTEYKELQVLEPKYKGMSTWYLKFKYKQYR